MKVFAISPPKIQNVTNKKEFMILLMLMVVEKSSSNFAFCDFNCIIIAWAS